jgi:hypothetical protein
MLQRGRLAAEELAVHRALVSQPDRDTRLQYLLTP